MTQAAYQVVVDGQVVQTYCEHEYVEALTDCAQYDYMYNSPELNDGVTGHVKVQLYYNNQPIVKEFSP